MRTQCNRIPLELKGHCSRRRLVAKKFIFFKFFFVSLRCPSCPFVDIFFPFLPLRDQGDRFQMRAAFRPRIFSRSSGLKKVISSLTRASSSARVGRS